MYFKFMRLHTFEQEFQKFQLIHTGFLIFSINVRTLNILQLEVWLMLLVLPLTLTYDI